MGRYIYIHGLPLYYWQPKAFLITRGIDTSLSFDDYT